MTAASEDAADAPSVTILWSTQTGHAKACARRTARIVRSQKGLSVSGGGYGSAFDDSPNVLASMQKNSLLMLFVSTTGDGEQCDCISQTWKALRSKSLPSTLFSETRFALFCLGDRAYGPQFCAAGRKLAARLVQLGAMPFCGAGYGDDGTPNGGGFYDLDVWIEQTLLPAIDEKFEKKLLPPLLSQHEELAPPSPYRVRVLNDTSSNAQADLDEWQRDEFNQYYKEYFSSWCPLTAYQYHGGKRLEHPDSTLRTAPHLGDVILNKRITASTWEQDTRHLQIRVDLSTMNEAKENESTNDASVAELPYQAGDVATILPFNSPEAVEKILKVLPSAIQSIADAELDIEYNVTGTASTNKWPRRCTLRGLLTYCADICTLPEREDLRALSYYCQQGHAMGQSQRDKLLSLSETLGAALYADYVLREKRGWADVLYDFDSIRWQGSTKESHNHALTLEALLALLPPIQPRHFSIASAPSQALIQASSVPEHCFDIDLCVAVVKGTTPLGRSYEGLCSNFLARQIPSCGRRMWLWIRPGSFGRLPLQIDAGSRFETPMLCIGAGTGVAPLRSLLMEREAVRTLTLSQNVGQDEPVNTDGDHKTDNVLVFGCRKKEADYYYRDEWEALVDSKRLNLLTAFSRDQWHKIYVQQVLSKAEGGKLIPNHVLERGGAIYVAGGAKMARAVKDEILECLAKDVGEKQAGLLLKKLQRVGKYAVEAWS